MNGNLIVWNYKKPDRISKYMIVTSPGSTSTRGLLGCEILIAIAFY